MDNLKNKLGRYFYPEHLISVSTNPVLFHIFPKKFAKIDKADFLFTKKLSSYVSKLNFA